MNETGHEAGRVGVRRRQAGYVPEIEFDGTVGSEHAGFGGWAMAAAAELGTELPI